MSKRHRLVRRAALIGVCFTLPWLAAFQPAPVVRTQSVAGCATLTRSDTAIFMRDVRRVVSEKSYEDGRRIFHIPHVPADSVQFYLRDAACDSAAASYQKSRADSGFPNVSIPVLITRLRGNHAYVGSAFIGDSGSREYVLWDSVFAVKSIFEVVY